MKHGGVVGLSVTSEYVVVWVEVCPIGPHLNSGWVFRDCLHPGVMGRYTQKPQRWKMQLRQFIFTTFRVFSFSLNM